MEHWFDDLARALGRQAITRRSMLSWTAKLGLAATGAGILGRTSPVVQAAGLGAVPAGGSIAAAPVAQAGSACTVDDSYGVLRTQFSTSLPGSRVPVTLDHTFVAEVATGATFAALTIKSGDKIVRRIAAATHSSGSGRASALHGAGHTGLRKATFSTDGRNLEGAIDERLVETATLAADVKDLKFKDGKPAPTAVVTPDLEKAVSDVLQYAQTQRVACQPDRQAPKAVATCTQRQLDCREAWLRCSLRSAHASLACGSLASVCYLKTATSDCDVALQRCFREAKASGACCPDYCKGDAGCCQRSWGCCAPNAKSQRWTEAWPTCPRCGPQTTAIERPDVTPVRRPGTPRPPQPAPGPRRSS